MTIEPLSIEQDGPGIDLSDQPEGLAIGMSDPVTDLEYARDSVTLAFDLSRASNVRLAVESMAFGTNRVRRRRRIDQASLSKRSG